MPNNEEFQIIYPLEWVAYEKKKDVFSFALVGYPVFPNGFVSYDDIDNLSELEYVIYLNEYDEDGIKVSIRKLSRFKFSTENASTQQMEYTNSHGLSANGDFYEERSKPKKNLLEGWRWVKQAEVDLGMLEVNNSQAQGDHNLKGFGLVCFLSHQVCEKALKGGVYAICGGKDARKINDHNLSPRVHMIRARVRLNDPRFQSLTSIIGHTNLLEDYYLKTRYPNCWKGDKIPADQFTSSEANNALASAKLVLEKVKGEIMPQT